MATFTNLYHATEALKHVLETRIIPAPASVVAGPPPDQVITTEELRVSLLWVNEQATHRNDGPVRSPDGTTAPPPATLSVFVLITGYGEDPTHNAAGAHRLLGEVVRVFAASPVIELPIAALPSNTGRGRLDVTLVPTTPELMEKLFSPLQIKHRPFLLYEVHPVQLVSTLATGPVAPVVAPGGVRLVGPTVSTPPVLDSLVPDTLAEGGYLRIDGAFSAPIDTIWIGAHRFVSPSFDVLDAGSSVGLALPTAGPNAIPPGIHRVTVMGSKLSSEAAALRIVPAGTWSLDGPKVLSAVPGATLALTGQGLSSASQAYLWPEAGIHAPSDVHKTGVVVIDPGKVELTVPALRPGRYRIALEIQLGPAVPLQFTPFVTLEIEP